jgi:enoyl-CoA hydratase/carnithine racemase
MQEIGSGVRTKRIGHVSVIAVDRVHRANALDSLTNLALGQAIIDADADPDVRCIVVTGSGRYFCAGADMSESLESGLAGGPDTLSFGGGLTGIDGRLVRPRKVTVAMVNGPAIGAGVELALACDFIVAQDTAYFQIPESQAGLLGHATVGHRVVRQLPERIGVEFVLSGRRMATNEAVRWGLINQVSPVQSLEADTLEFCARFTGPGAQAQQAARTALVEGLEGDLRTSLARRYHAVEAYTRSADFRDAVARTAR